MTPHTSSFWLDNRMPSLWHWPMVATMIVPQSVSNAASLAHSYTHPQVLASPRHHMMTDPVQRACSACSKHPRDSIMGFSTAVSCCSWATVRWVTNGDSQPRKTHPTTHHMHRFGPALPRTRVTTTTIPMAMWLQWCCSKHTPQCVGCCVGCAV